MSFPEKVQDFVLWDAERDEPYISHPDLPGLRLTPVRRDDTDELFRLYNIPSIGKRSHSRPYPCPLSAVVDRIEKFAKIQAKDIERLRSILVHHETTNHPIKLGFPFHLLRDSSNRVIGGIGFTPFDHDPSNNFADVDVTEMLARPVDQQVWILGYSLDPDYQGRGIVGRFVSRLFEGYIKECMGVKTIVAGIEPDNPQSIKVAERAGFERKVVIEIPFKGGDMRAMGHYVKKL
ncbi:hypothetical protein P7C73_g2668, partial [Tremellales sp. Uapishka_1]